MKSEPIDSKLGNLNKSCNVGPSRKCLDDCRTLSNFLRVPFTNGIVKYNEQFSEQSFQVI